MLLFTIFIALLFVLSLVNRWLDRSIITAPILFAGVGMLAFVVVPELREHEVNREAFRNVAEAGLVLLLFTDASRANLQALKRNGSLPLRLLSIGMLLTILLGAIFAKIFLPQLSLWEAGVLAAILAPTDAGLGQIIVNSPKVPERIRQALNVEAGLNDGLSVPFMLFFVGLAAASAKHQVGLFQVMMEQLAFGALIGAVIGLVGGWLLRLARRRNWTDDGLLQIGVVVLPLLCAVVCEAARASMFIAAFVAGMAVQIGFKDAGRHSVHFAENWGQLFNLAVFFLFGLIVMRNRASFTGPLLLYAILSLTVVRMLPVAIALLGTRLSAATVGFMGWFGPRGLASIVLGLVYLGGESDLPGEKTIVLSVMLTVIVSIFTHGLTALPGMNGYARRVAALGAAAPEYATGATPTLKAHV